MARARGAPESSPWVSAVEPYRPSQRDEGIDLVLSANEGPPPPTALLDALRGADVELLRRYPDIAGFEARIARWLGIEPERVVATAGADDALERALRSHLWPGRELVLPVPTFEMIERYALLAGGTVVKVPWLEGPLPVDRMIAAGTERTGVVAVVTPNSPTGLAAAEPDIERLAEAFPNALLIVDLAYTEFADEDLTPFALSLPRAVVTRSFSKAMGLAGLRVGFAAAPTEIAGLLRSAGHPYALSGPSILLATARLDLGLADVLSHARRIKEERRELSALVSSMGGRPLPSQGNFLFCRFGDAACVKDGLARRGIGVRAFPGAADLEDALRITLPGDAELFARLEAAITAVLGPEND